MLHVTFHKDGHIFEGQVKPDSNLVVRAGVRQFPFPHLSYGCGMGKCGKCASRMIAGAEHLPPPNWKEEKVLGPLLADGFRLCCQVWLTHDLVLEQNSA